MTEELKIIITAVTGTAKKELEKVSKELSGLGKSANGVKAVITKAFKTVAIAAAAVVTSIVAISAALVKLGKNSIPVAKEQARLIAAFEAAGSTAAQASKSYEELYRFLGDSGKASEAAAHLAKITTNQEDLAEWTKITQGIYATFGDSLPIESLTEAANETMRVGKVTGVMADALNWAGVSEDAFNAQLAQTTTLQEREALIRNTLNGLYTDAAEVYERNNKALLDYNASQAQVDATLAEAGKAIMPLLTALNNLSATLLSALKPALDAIIPPIVEFINMISKAVQFTMSFFSALTGKNQSVKAVQQVNKTVGAVTKSLGTASNGAGDLSSGLGGASDGAGDLASGLDDAAKAAEEAKKTTAGFDELNIISSGKSTSSGGSGASTPSYGTGGTGGGSAAGGAPAYGGGDILGGSFETEVTESDSAAGALADKVKKVFSEIKKSVKDAAAAMKKTFAPSIESWGGAFETVKASWEASKPSYISGISEIGQAFKTLGSYLVQEFIPEIVNSFSVNLAPLIGDIFGFSLEEAGLAFEWFGQKVNQVTNDLIIPTLDLIKMVGTDIFDSIGTAWDEYGQPLMDAFSETFESIRNTLDLFYKTYFLPIWENIKEVFTDVWQNGLKPLVDKVVAAVLVIATELSIFYNEVIAPIIDWIIENIYPTVVNFVNNIIKIIGSAIKTISGIIGGIVDVIKGIVQFIVGVFTGDWKKAWEGIKNIFKGVWDAIKSIFKGTIDAIKLVFGTVKTFFSDKLREIKAIFSGIGTWFRGIFQGAWNNIKAVFSGVGEFFGGIWDKVKTKFTSLGTSIGNAISGAVKSGINGVISMIEKTINGTIKLINGAIGLINEIPGVNIKKMKELDLPRLAKGGVVNSATAAIIGEQGKEAIVPLENNTEWMDKLATRLASILNTPSRIVLMLDGKELGWANINSINSITKQTGKLQLTMA